MLYHRILAVILAATPLLCQPSAPTQFEAASVKTAVYDRTASCRGGPGSADPGRFVCNSWSLRDLVLRAWELTSMALSAPDSIDDVRFSISAAVPSHTTKHDFNLMLRQLLIDRIALVVHHETREQPVFDMMIAKGGHKLRPAEPLPDGASANDPSVPRLIRDQSGNMILPPGRPASVVGALPGGMYRMSVRMHPVSDIAASLEWNLKRRVIDKTGLAGLYDYTIDYAPDTVANPRSGMPEPAPSADAPSPKPDFVEAVRQQLGLTLQSARAKVDVLVVDSFRKTPTEN